MVSLSSKTETETETETETVEAKKSPCDLFNLKEMKKGATCTATWDSVRTVLHPSQEAVGYAAVKRKIDKDYKSEKKAQKRMNQSAGFLPFVLGPNQVPYLVDSHHTASALEASGFHSVQVTLQKVCDWSHLSEDTFVKRMKQQNFMMGTGRGDSLQQDNLLPVPVDVSRAIPPTIGELHDDPWRSLSALVRKTKSKECPPGNKKCLRGYLRDCRKDGRMTPFFEFRWAYFMNDAYHRGCHGPDSYWDEPSECLKFEKAYQVLQKQEKKKLQGSTKEQILAKDAKAWQTAADLLVPLCRGQAAQTYVLPVKLERPMGGKKLPGYVAGAHTPILQDDPSCAAPTCPTFWSSFWGWSNLCFAAPRCESNKEKKR